MADVKISALPLAGLLDGSEYLPIVQGGVTVKVLVSVLAPAIAALLPPAINAPVTRTLAASTAYQASNPLKSSHMTVNFTSSATLSLTAGTTNNAKIVVGPSNTVVSSQDYTVGNYINSLLGTLIVGLGLNQSQGSTCSFVLPPGWYFAIIPVNGSVTLTSALDQQIG